MTNNAITRESFPILISVKEASKIGLTKNAFYSISHKYSYMCVELGGRIFLRRDELFSWIDCGGEQNTTRKVIA